MGSHGSVPEPVEHSQRRASRAGINGLGSANYQTKPNPDRYSETKPKPLTLELLWILRALPNAADPSHRFCADCALCEYGLRLAVFYGKVAEEHCVRLSQEGTASSEPCGRTQGRAYGAGEAARSPSSSDEASSGSEAP